MNFKTSFSSVVFLASFSNRKAQFTHTQLSKIEEITNQNREYKQKNSYPIHTHTHKNKGKKLLFSQLHLPAGVTERERVGECCKHLRPVFCLFVCLLVAFRCRSPQAQHSTHSLATHTHRQRDGQNMALSSLSLV